MVDGDSYKIWKYGLIDIFRKKSIKIAVIVYKFQDKDQMGGSS